MYQLLDTNLFVGSIEDAFLYLSDEWAVVHVTPIIHYNIMGWDKKKEEVNKKNPNYVYYEKKDRLSLNWLDNLKEIDKCNGHQTLIDVLDFIDRWIGNKKICVHCDHGFSRSPSICLLYLAKRTNYISNKSFAQAKKDFVQIYTKYTPSRIGDYIKDNWEKII